MAANMRKRTCAPDENEGKRSRNERPDTFNVFISETTYPIVGGHRSCRLCKKGLNGTCVKHDDAGEKHRVKEAMRKRAESRDKYLQKREDEEYRRLSPGEKHWYDHFAYYRNGGFEADHCEYDSGELENDNKARKSNDHQLSESEEWHDSRDYCIYYHMSCFANLKQKAKNMTALAEPTFLGKLSSDEKKRVSQIWAALKAGASVQEFLPENCGHLTEEQFNEIEDMKNNLKKKAVSGLRAALKRNEQGLLHGKPKSVLLDSVSELMVLGALPKCPVCRGGRNGKGGNLSWSREMDSYSCSGFFGSGGPQACNGPGQKHTITRTAARD